MNNNQFSSGTYELDWNRPERDNRYYIGVLTGLPASELLAACPKKDLWRGPEFVQAFKKLGFNTSEGWVKFDSQTDKPCLLRTTSDQKNMWFVWIYHNGVINNRWTVGEWREEYKELRITSMLQVWL
ncbi:hypothetical protein LZD49_26390 [Dyadobacter sp. CY261]|uniref:hypothetical protein n=1 Tax=Dyadobacter sp. CY261 TaxID=2907203 RepID=UPI001F1F6EB5|nr:hypothetical protein [Dyadobacter sp. CY261]MCF0074039.1 hypothetical protein [Dyadobacter sp. CY261]